MAQPLAALIVRVMSDTSEVVTGMNTVTTKVKETEREVVRAGTNIAALSSGVDQFDRSLAQVGISLGPLPGALREISAASGQTIAQLGMLGTAGLAAAAAFGGWQIGRSIADLLQLDEAIGEATASLLGWGDVAAEEAAVSTNTLAIASKAAKREITDLSEAIAFLTIEADKNTIAMQKVAEAHTMLGMIKNKVVRPDADAPGGFREGIAEANAITQAVTESEQARIKAVIQLVELREEEAKRIRKISEELTRAATVDQQRVNLAVQQNLLTLERTEATRREILAAGGANPAAPDQVGDILAKAQRDVEGMQKRGAPEEHIGNRWREAQEEINKAVLGIGNVAAGTKTAADEAARFAGQIQMAHVTMAGASGGDQPFSRDPSIFSTGKFKASPFVSGDFTPERAPGIVNNWNISGVMAADQASFMRQIDSWFTQRMTQGTLRGGAR